MSARRYAILIVSSLLILFLRDPWVLTQSHLWAEDGAIFLSAAHNKGGLNSLFVPYAGYLHLVPRLVAAFACGFPLRNAAQVMNTIALLFQISPCLWLFSERSDRLFLSQKTKLAVAIIYLCLPGTYEIHGTITNTQWFLPVTMSLILFCERSKSPTIRILEGMLFALASFTGPFCVFVLLAAVVAMSFSVACFRRIHWLLLALGSLTQTACLSLAPRLTRAKWSIGLMLSSYNLFLSKIGSVPFFGNQHVRHYFSTSVIDSVLFNLPFLVVILLTFCMLPRAQSPEPRAQSPFLLFLNFVAWSIAGSWAVLLLKFGNDLFLGVWNNSRYFELAVLAAMMTWTVRALSPGRDALTWSARALLAASLLSGVILDFTVERDFQMRMSWAESVDLYYDRALTGETVKIPVLPVGTYADFQKK